jgi:plastocyanin
MIHRARSILTVLAVTAVTVVGGVSVAAAATAHASSATITVTAVEFKFTLSKSSAAPGLVTFKVVNKGKIMHDFKIDGKKTALIAPGKSATLAVTFTKAGAYPYVCTVPGHSALGMKGTFKIT